MKLEEVLLLRQYPDLGPTIFPPKQVALASGQELHSPG